MPQTIRDKTLALAGIFQACRLVHQAARTGSIDNNAFSATINSLFCIDAATTDAIYGGADKLEVGITTLLEQLGGKDAQGSPKKPHDMDITRYAISVMVLERKLAKNPAMLKAVTDGIERATTQAQHFSTTHDNVIANLAGLYSDTLSTLTPRIMVNGEQPHIASPPVINKIRAALLGAIRSAVLWRQNGGRRWQLLVSRKGVLDEAQRILDKEIRRNSF